MSTGVRIDRRRFDRVMPHQRCHRLWVSARLQDGKLIRVHARLVQGDLQERVGLRADLRDAHQPAAQE